MIKLFAHTYWHHAKSIMDIILFVVSLISILLGVQIKLALPVGLVLMVVVALMAAYRTWLYQYRQTQELIESKDKDIEYDDLNDLQKAILAGMNTESDKRIILIPTNAGVIFMGIGDTCSQYDKNEIGAEIVELEGMNILRVDDHSHKSGKPIYMLTSLGFKILKQLNTNLNIIK